MNPPVRLHALALAVGAALAVAATPARAQDATPAEPYRDRIIAAEALEPLPPEEDEIVDAGGLPRSLSVELLTSRTDRGDETFQEHGLSVAGFWETAALGSFSLDATLLRSDRSRDQAEPWGGTATLWQRGLYLDGGWRGNNGLGVLNTSLPGLLREQYRFILPSVTFAGVGTEWLQTEKNLQLQASYGRGGSFDGARVVGFDLADGDVASFASQWQWAPGWTGAAAALATDGRLIPDDDGGLLVQESETRALLVATGWKDANDGVTLTLQSSDGDLGNAVGAWADGRADRGRYSHRYGLFRLEPGLAWGALPIANDAQGAYYRIAYQHARWSWNAGLDRIDSVSGDSFEGSYGNLYARYQASTLTGFGGGVNVRDSQFATAYSTQLFVDRSHRWGQSRLQYDHLDGGAGGGDSWEFKLDHALPMKQGTRLSFSLTHGSLSFEGEPATKTTSFSTFGGVNLTDRLSLDGSARYSRGSGPEAFRGTDLNLNLTWRIATRWWLIGSVYENRGSRRSPFILDPLAPDTYYDLPRDRSIFLSLRYERRAGTPSAVLGGAPGSAVGAIAGSIFLDDNGDGERAASELPAANITVVLDGRYSVRTDSQGNFEFPRVAVGNHVLTVLPDNLPLPWSFDEEADKRSIEVKVREQHRVDIGARRPR